MCTKKIPAVYRVCLQMSSIVRVLASYLEQLKVCENRFMHIIHEERDCFPLSGLCV